MQGGALIGIDRPSLTTPVERELGDGVAWEGVETLLFLERLRPWHRAPERIGGGGRRGDQRASRIDDGVKPRSAVDRLSANGDDAVADDPIAGGGREGVILDVPGVQIGVGASQEELRAGGSELECEDALRNNALLDSSGEEWVLLCCYQFVVQ